MSRDPAFLKYPEQLRHYIYTDNQLERVGKEMKRRARIIEASPRRRAFFPISTLSSRTGTKGFSRGGSGVLPNCSWRRKAICRTRIS
ncbi:MAG: transposase [Actinobacteria bacterium]|nr:transposase [Actinomycetota bacterium]